MRRVVLDASALMTFFDDRPGAERVQRLFTQVIEARLSLLMSVVNWGEVYYSVWRTKGKETAEGILSEIAQSRVEIIPADTELTKLAAQFRIHYRLPYADCFAAGLAYQRKAALATADKDFLVMKRLLKILWTTEA